MLMWMDTTLQDRRMVISKSDVKLTNVLSKMRKRGKHCLLPTADGFDLILAWSHQWDGGFSPCNFSEDLMDSILEPLDNGGCLVRFEQVEDWSFFFLFLKTEIFIRCHLTIIFGNHRIHLVSQVCRWRGIFWGVNHSLSLILVWFRWDLEKTLSFVF